MLSESTEFRYRGGAQCNFNTFVVAYKNACPKQPVPKLTDVSFIKLGYSIDKIKKCKDCNVIFNKSKKCCEHHHKNNVTTTHVIRNLLHIDSRSKFFDNDYNDLN